jgi:short-subunit dehydrogenase
MSETNTITRPLEPEKTAVVVGASSGIGAALVKELTQQGYKVAAIARREALLKELCSEVHQKGGKVSYFTHNVANYDEVPGLLQQVTKQLGGLDLIVYAAGVQLPVHPDEYDFAKDKVMIDVNLLGAMAWLNETAVRFSRTGSGHIVAIGSIAGDRGRVGAPGYNTSKAALATYLEALRNRLAPQGIHVTTIKPGFVDTVLLENAAKTFWVIPPEKAAKIIYNAIHKQKQTVYVPARWGLVGLIIRHIPSFIFRRMKF